MKDFSAILNILLGGGVVAMLTAAVAAIRKYRSGEIVDDDAVIARLDKDNQKLRSQNDEKDKLVEKERRLRWRAEDQAARWKRKLMTYEEPEEDR